MCVFQDDIALATRDLEQLHHEQNYRVAENTTGHGKSRHGGIPLVGQTTDKHHNLGWKTHQNQSSVFQYLGHLFAHPTHMSPTRSQMLAKVKSGLSRHEQLPLSASERAQLINLINAVLIPRWLYHAMFVHYAFDQQARVSIRATLERVRQGSIRASSQNTA